MTEFTSGQLVFKSTLTLGAAHSLASEMARLNSDVHILDVGYLVQGAWVAGWLPLSKAEEASVLARSLGLENVQVSDVTMNAMFSLGPVVEKSDEEVLVVESEEKDLFELFTFIESNLLAQWKLVEIRLHKSGPAGAHAFLVGKKDLSISATDKKLRISRALLNGDYRRFF